MAQFDYIAELKTPSLKLHENGSMPSPSDIEAYFVKVEHMRQEYLAFISEKSEKVQKVCLSELQEAAGEIEKRGFVQLRGDDLAAAVVAGVSEAHTLMLLQNIDSRLKASAEKTIAFVKSLLGNDAVVPSQASELEKVEENVVDTGWYGIDEVCKKYRLPKNNVKSRKWRIENGFPTHQDGAYTSVRFNASEVEEWISNRK